MSSITYFSADDGFTKDHPLYKDAKVMPDTVSVIGSYVSTGATYDDVQRRAGTHSPFLSVCPGPRMMDDGKSCWLVVRVLKGTTLPACLLPKEEIKPGPMDPALPPIGDMTVAQMRSACRAAGIAPPARRGGAAALASASKSVLTEALVRGSWPDTDPDPEPAKASPSMPVPDTARAMAEALAAMLAFNKPSLDEARVREIASDVMDASALMEQVTGLVNDAIKASGSPVIRVKVGEQPEIKVGRQHERFPLLLCCIAARVNTLLVGPAGTGKSRSCEEAAKALSLHFLMCSVGPQTSKSDLLGFIDAGGTYRESMFVEAYRTGAVFLLDEVDAGNASVLTVINGAMAGTQMATPAGMVPRHKDFILICAANTYGHGADRQYVGRNQLDAATLDRVAVLDWPIDEGLESHLCGLSAPDSYVDVKAGGIMAPKKWLSFVRSFRRAVAEENLRYVISPRASMLGVALFNAGMGMTHVQELALWRGMPADARNRVQNRIGGAK